MTLARASAGLGMRLSGDLANAPTAHQISDECRRQENGKSPRSERSRAFIVQPKSPAETRQGTAAGVLLRHPIRGPLGLDTRWPGRPISHPDCRRVGKTLPPTGGRHHQLLSRLHHSPLRLAGTYCRKPSVQLKNTITSTMNSTPCQVERPLAESFLMGGKQMKGIFMLHFLAEVVGDVVLNIATSPSQNDEVELDEE